MLGIIGGVSPFACSEFYNSLCEKYREKNGVYPELLIYSIKISSLHEEEFLCNRVSDNTLNYVKEELNKACLLFEKNNIKVVTICCNTLSNIFFEIASKYNFNSILTPVYSTNKYILTKKKKCLLLSTNFTAKNELYKNVVFLNNDDQKLLQEFLKDKINSIPTKIEINEMLKKYDFDFLVLGCTDVTKKDISLNTTVIDSNDCLLNDILTSLGGV